MWTIVTILGGAFVLIAGILMVVNGETNGWMRIATGVMLLLAGLALRQQGKKSKKE